MCRRVTEDSLVQTAEAKERRESTVSRTAADIYQRMAAQPGEYYIRYGHRWISQQIDLLEHLCRFLGWMLTKAWRRLFTRIVVI